MIDSVTLLHFHSFQSFHSGQCFLMENFRDAGDGGKATAGGKKGACDVQARPGMVWQNQGFRYIISYRKHIPAGKKKKNNQ